MKRQIILLLALCCMGVALAQTQTAKTSKSKKVEATGTVYDAETKEIVSGATVQLYTLPDTTFATGAASDDEGKFVLDAVAAGTYLLRISYVGYSAQGREIKLTGNKSVENLGMFFIEPDAVALKETVVNGRLAQVQMVEDTLVFNSAAFKVPEGSVLEELIKKYPGVEVADDGSITVNGKKVTKILLGGKEYFGTDTKVAMKNVPVEMIEKVKAYDKQSDFTRVTGIDDGEEETVLDLQVKKGMEKGWFSNINGAYGTKDRYAASGIANRFSENSKFSVIGSANNVNDMGFPGGGGGFRGGRNNGLVANKFIGTNFAYDIENKLELGGNLRYSHSSTDNQSYTSSETFMTTGNKNQFSTSQRQAYGSSDNWNGDFRVEWKPDTMTNLIFRPSFSYSTSKNQGRNFSATFNEDPFAYVTDYRRPDYGFIDGFGFPDSILVNNNSNYSNSENSNLSANGNLQFNRKFNSLGRNLTLRGRFAYSESQSYSLSANTVEYLQPGMEERGYQRNRYSSTPNKNWNYNVQITYSEPIALATYLQFSYNFQYSYQNSDRKTYVFDNYAHFLQNVFSHYKGGEITNAEMLALTNGAVSLADSLDEDQSRFSMYRNYTHEAEIMFRMIRDKFNFNVGVTWLPQHSTMTYNYLGLDTVVSRTVHNFTPTMRFRYRWDKQTQLNIDYRGRTAQPSITDMMDITDDSNPLYITKGNPGLKPSFNNNLNARFNTYNVDLQRGMMAYLSFSNTLNRVSNFVEYNEETGGRISQPQNINGNWNMDGGYDFNIALGRDNFFYVSTRTNGGFNHDVAYISTSKAGNNGSSVRNSTNTLRLNERLTLSFRSENADEVSLNGYLGYTYSRNREQPSSNLDTYNFSYGPSCNFTLPWEVKLSSDLSMSSRRGYSDASFNTNELLWNAQISKSFLKGNAATLSFQMYDILHQQSNLSRNISAYERSDTQYNTIHSYCMLRLTYRLNVFGDKEARNRMRNNGGFGFPGGGGFEGRGGFGGGGFGGRGGW